MQGDSACWETCWIGSTVIENVSRNQRKYYKQRIHVYKRNVRLRTVYMSSSWRSRDFESVRSRHFRCVIDRHVAFFDVLFLGVLRSRTDGNERGGQNPRIRRLKGGEVVSAADDD